MPLHCAIAFTDICVARAQVWRAIWKPCEWLRKAGRVEFAMHKTQEPAPPKGYPRASGHHVLPGLQHAQNESFGMCVDVEYDADNGTLAFAMSFKVRSASFREHDTTISAPMSTAVVGFPRGVPLRPWVQLCSVGTEVWIDTRQKSVLT